MARSATATASLSTKRKRAQVSYAEEDDQLDTLLEAGEGIESQVEDDSAYDSDLTYGSRKKKPKRKPAKRAKATPKRDQKPFPFLTLPPELRDYIYELALTDSKGVGILNMTKSLRRTVTRGPVPEADGSDYWNHRARRRCWPQGIPQQSQQSTTKDSEPNTFVPALLAVNKQIYAEAINYLYHQQIVVEDTYALHSFLAACGSNRSRFTDLVVCGWGKGRGACKSMNFCALTLLAQCTNLRSVYLDCQIGWISRPKNLARQIYRDGFHFLEAFGIANGARDAAIDVLKLSKKNFDRNNWGHVSWRGRIMELPEKDDFEAEFKAELRRLLSR